MYDEGNRRPRFVPVKIGDEIDVKIEAVGEKGDGIAKKDGFVLFVPGVKQGDDVKVKVTKVLKRVGFAEVIEDAAPQEAAPEETTEEASSEEPAQEETKGPVEDTEDFGEE